MVWFYWRFYNLYVFVYLIILYKTIYSYIFFISKNGKLILTQRKLKLVCLFEFVLFGVVLLIFCMTDEVL